MARDSGTDDPRVRVRPDKRGSRPRTKVRPSYDDAQLAMVLTVDRGRYGVLLDDPQGRREIVAVKAKELGRQGGHRGQSAIVVGDRVRVVGDTSGDEGTLARIVGREDRRSVLRRSLEESASGYERVIVANADQLVIVVAAAQPEPRPRLVDRCLVAAYDAGMEPLLCLTKADLADPAEFLARYAALDVPTVVTSSHPDDPRHDEGLAALHERLTGRTSVLVGHSGVGKSTLVNALVPEAARATGAVNVVTGRGRHTSSSAVALELTAGGVTSRGDHDPSAGGGWIIDTPGVRSFGLQHVKPEDLLAAFEDLAEVATDCPRGCAHADTAPDCALDVWGEQAGEADRARLASFRMLLASRTPEQPGS